MIVKTHAIVIRQVKYADNKIIVDMFTRDEGAVSFAIKLSTSAKGKMRRQLFQPLTLLYIEADVRERQQLHKLREATIFHPYSSLTIDMDKIAIGIFVSEFLYYALRQEVRNPQLFDFVADSLMWLDEAKTSYANFHLVFLLRISIYLGFYPNVTNYADGDWFDLRNACFVSTQPSHKEYLAPNEARRIGTIMRMNYANSRLFRMSHIDRQRLLEIIIDFYRIHIPNFPELKSLDVLTTIYSFSPPSK